MRNALPLLLLLSCSTPQIVFDNNVAFEVELAETPEQRTKGLMFRESMSDREGMLFIFDNKASRSFWMKNTLISLDMIFIDEDMNVVEVKSNIQPCEADPCPFYPSQPAMYVLEINAGLAEKKNIQVGSQVNVI